MRYHVVQQFHTDRVVGDRRGGDHHRDDQPEGVDREASLAPRDLLRRVLAGRGGRDVVGRPDRLGVQRHRGRTLPAAGPLPRLTAQQIVDHLVGAIVTPQGEVVVGLPRFGGQGR